MSEETARRRGHETRDVHVRGVAWFAFGLSVAVAVVFVALTGLYRLFEQGQPSFEAPSRGALPAPRLQTDAVADWNSFQAAEEAKLHSYGWIDREAGVIHIPIERAMELIAQRGLSTRGPGTQDASGVTSVQLQERKAAETKP